MNDIADEAVRLAKRGKPVFPCNVEKRPYTANGFKEASTAEDVIRGWWARWPDALIGVPTGPVSGFVVLDVDVKDGRAGDDSLAQCQRDLGVLPDTVEALTPNGGRHLYFRYPKDCDIRCSAGQLGSGLDVRGDGGYVIAPPSVIHGRAYQWEASSEPGKVAVAELPAAWCARLARRLPTAPTANTDDNIPDGLRNTTLASLAGTMRRRGMSQPAIEAGLLAENQNRCKPPLPEEDVRRIAASVSRYEPDNTRTGNTRATQWPNTRAQEPGEREPKVDWPTGAV